MSDEGSNGMDIGVSYEGKDGISLGCASDRLWGPGSGAYVRAALWSWEWQGGGEVRRKRVMPPNPRWAAALLHG